MGAGWSVNGDGLECGLGWTGAGMGMCEEKEGVVIRMWDAIKVFEMEMWCDEKELRNPWRVT